MNQEEQNTKIEKLQSNVKKLWTMNEAVYREKKKTDQLNESLLNELDQSEVEKSKFKEKNKKLWSQSVAIHKEKERIDSLKKQLEYRNKEIMDSINYAKRIQAAILPSHRYLANNLPNHHIIYLPKDIVAGDFYWMENIQHPKYENHELILYAACDCTGHGVPGALVSVICNNALNRSVREFGLSDPGEILDKTRDIVITEFEKSDEEVKDGMDISLVSLALRTQNKNESDPHSDSDSKAVLHWAGANNPLWIIRNKEVLETKPDKQPIGKYDKNEPFTTHKLELESGDCIYVFTDGFQDQFGGPKGKKFKPSNFKKLLIEISDLDIQVQKEKITAAFHEWKSDQEQLDDVCIIGVKV